MDEIVHGLVDRCGGEDWIHREVPDEGDRRDG
jgi:hypothetical protein